MELSQSGLRHTGGPAREERKTLSLARRAMSGMRALRAIRGVGMETRPEEGVGDERWRDRQGEAELKARCVCRPGNRSGQEVRLGGRGLKSYF